MWTVTLHKGDKTFVYPRMQHISPWFVRPLEYRHNILIEDIYKCTAIDEEAQTATGAFWKIKRMGELARHFDPKRLR